MTHNIPPSPPRSTIIAYREFCAWYTKQFGRAPVCTMADFVRALRQPCHELAVEDPTYRDGKEEINGDYR